MLYSISDIFRAYFNVDVYTTMNRKKQIYHLSVFYNILAILYLQQKNVLKYFYRDIYHRIERYRDYIHNIKIDLFVSIALFALLSVLKIKLAYILASEKRAIKINRSNHSLIKTDFCFTLSIDITDLCLSACLLTLLCKIIKFPFIVAFFTYLAIINITYAIQSIITKKQLKFYFQY